MVNDEESERLAGSGGVYIHVNVGAVGEGADQE